MFMHFAAMMPTRARFTYYDWPGLPGATLQLNNTNASPYKNFQQKATMNLGWSATAGLVFA